MRKEAREQGKREAERIRQKAKDESEAELMESRKQAVMLGQDARQEAEATVKDAKEESERVREQTQRAVEGRVAGAERAAAEVLKEAQALSGGLRQLGRSLEEQADRILRDVQAAHRRMQADLRVQSGDELPDVVRPRAAGPAPAPPSDEPAPPAREAAAAPPRSPTSRRRRRTRSTTSKCPAGPGSSQRLARHQPRGRGLEGRHRADAGGQARARRPPRPSARPPSAASPAAPPARGCRRP